MKKKTLIPFFLIVAIGISFKPTDRFAKPEFVNSFLETWDIMTINVLEVVDAMPSDKFDYRPTDVSRTFGDQIIHLGYINKFFTQTFIEGKQIQYNHPSAEGMSKAEIRKYVEESLKYSRKIISEMDESDLNNQVPFGQERLKNVRKNGKVSKQMVLLLLNNHITNTRAKANLYVRLNGIDPPAYNF